ncbi:MAG TPA: hypothetical protein VF746_17065 [Longimicrobium sp.]|jgi:hypothetical protein
MRALARRLALPLLVVLAAPGCVTYTAHQMPGPSSRERLPNPVRVTRSDASTVLLFDAALAADSVVGFTGGGSASGQRVAVAMGDVRMLESRKTNATGTAGLVAAAALAAGVVILALGSSGGTAY